MTLPEGWPDGDGEVELGYEGDDAPDLFARVTYYVLDFPGLSRVAKDAYVCLIRCLGWGENKERKRVTRAQLAAVMSISVDTLDRGLKELESKGIIEVIRRRDTATGNWTASSYRLKDTKSSRMRARIVELEQALGKRAPKGEASPQVSASPQNAARTKEGESGSASGHQSANCGLDATCDDAPSPQVSTSPQNAAPPSRNLPTGRAADCGHRRDSSSKREEQREEKEDQVLAVGELTEVDAREASAPPAQPDDLSSAAPHVPAPRRPVTTSRHLAAGRSLIAAVRRYRYAPGWAKTKHLAPMAAQALDRFGRDAIIRYAELVAGEGAFAEHQHIPEFREALRKLGRDVELGTVCRRCGHPVDGCPCTTAPLPAKAFAAEWTREDQVQWERVLEFLGVTPDDLQAGS